MLMYGRSHLTIAVVLKLKINKLRGKKAYNRTFLVVHWLRICLPMWGTQARSQEREDSSCLGAVKPVGHKPMCLEQVLHNKRSHGDERPCSTAKSSRLPTPRESLCTATKSQHGH